jgi:hypothetical protein
VDTSVFIQTKNPLMRKGSGRIALALDNLRQLIEDAMKRSG